MVMAGEWIVSRMAILWGEKRSERLASDSHIRS